MCNNKQKMKYRKHPGVVFITALVSMMVMFLLCMVLLRIGRQQILNTERDLKSVHASAAADAGISRLLWAQKYPSESGGDNISDDQIPEGMDYDQLIATTPLLSFSLGEEDETNVWIMKYMHPAPNDARVERYEVISEGLFRDYPRTVRANIRGVTMKTVGPSTILPTVFNNALFSGTSMTLKGTTKITGSVGCNGDLSMGGTATVTGGASVSGVITGKTGNITGAKLTGQPQVPLTGVLEMANLAAYAAANGGEVYEGDKHFSGAETVMNKVIYVNGDVTINANTVFSGLVTIVATGNVTINGNVSSVGPADTTNLSIISPNSIIVKCTGNAQINATIIAPGVEADFTGIGTATITGGVIANSVSASGTFDIVYKKPNDALVIIPPPPDVDAAYLWTEANWEQIN